MTKYINVGSIVENESKAGEKYLQLILNKEFLADAKNVLQHVYTDKLGNKRMSLYKPSEKAPKHIKYNISVKVEE